MVEIDKIAVGERTKEFALKRFGSIKGLADAVHMGYNGFHSTYIKGRSLPGAKILATYITLGCDINWLLFGGNEEFKVAEGTQQNWYLNIEVERLKEENEQLKIKLSEIQKLINSK